MIKEHIAVYNANYKNKISKAQSNPIVMEFLLLSLLIQMKQYNVSRVKITDAVWEWSYQEFPLFISYRNSSFIKIVFTEFFDMAYNEYVRPRKLFDIIYYPKEYQFCKLKTLLNELDANVPFPEDESA